MKPASADKTLQAYVAAATLHGKATLEGNHKAANRAATALKRIYSNLQRDQFLAEKLLRAALVDANASVRIWASAHALGMGVLTDQAIGTLQEASANHDLGLLRLDAETTLSEWRKQGRLEF